MKYFKSAIKVKADNHWHCSFHGHEVDPQMCEWHCNRSGYGGHDCWIRNDNDKELRGGTDEYKEEV